MQRHERLKRAELAREACEAELRRLLEQQAFVKSELDRYTRALALLQARARALRPRDAEEACA